jgi:hypothetical protein
MLNRVPRFHPEQLSQHRAAFTNATMPVLMASDSSGQAATISAKSGGNLRAL